MGAELLKIKRLGMALKNAHLGRTTNLSLLTLFYGELNTFGKIENVLKFGKLNVHI